MLLISAAVGIALAQMKPSKAQETLVSLFAGLQEVLFRIVSWIIPLQMAGRRGVCKLSAREICKMCIRDRDDTYVQAFSTIAVNGGGIQFGEYSLYVRGYVVVPVSYTHLG